jgi:hypothetical protein
MEVRKEEEEKKEEEKEEEEEASWTNPSRPIPLPTRLGRRR